MPARRSGATMISSPVNVLLLYGSLLPSLINFFLSLSTRCLTAKAGRLLEAAESGGREMSFGRGDREVEPKFLEWGQKGIGVLDRWGGAEGQIKWSQARKFLEYPFSKIMWEPLPIRPVERIICLSWMILL